MVGTRKTSVRFSSYLASFPIGLKQNYVLEVSSSISKNNNGFISNSRRVIEIEYSENEHKFFINLKTKSLKLYLSKEANRNRRIAELLASVYDEIKLQVNPDGSVKFISNLKNIIEKWKIIKQELNDEYGGSELNWLLNGLDRRFSSEDLILEEILQYDFFGLLLNPIFQDYQTENSKIRMRVLNWYTEKISINEYLMLHDISEQDKKVWILLKKESQANDKINEFNGYYELNMDSHAINEAELILGSSKKSRKYAIKKV